MISFFLDKYPKNNMSKVTKKSTKPLFETIYNATYLMNLRLLTAFIDSHSEISHLNAETELKKLEYIMTGTNPEINEHIKLPLLKYPLPAPYCQAIVYGNGLFHQCTKKIKKENKIYCPSCESSMKKNNTTVPVCGTVDDRNYDNPYEFTDSKNRRPVSYITYMKKHKFTKEEAIDFAEKQGFEIHPDHFDPDVQHIEEVGEKAKGGRPKKQSIIKEEEPVEDKESQTDEDNKSLPNISDLKIESSIDQVSQDEEEDEQEEDEEDEEEEEEDNDIEEITINKRTYKYNISSLIVYDSNMKQIGMLSTNKKNITFINKKR